MYYIIISHYCNRGFYFDVFFSITIMTMGEDVFICQNNAKMQKKKIYIIVCSFSCCSDWWFVLKLYIQKYCEFIKVFYY